MGLNEKNDNGDTTLIWAAKEKQTKIALALIEKGAKLDEADDSNYNEFVWIQRLKEEREENRAKKIKLSSNNHFFEQVNTGDDPYMGKEEEANKMAWAQMRSAIPFLAASLVKSSIGLE